MSELYATSDELVVANYVVLVLFAGAVLACFYKGTAGKDRNVLRWNLMGSAGCILVLLFGFANLAGHKLHQYRYRQYQ